MRTGGWSGIDWRLAWNWKSAVVSAITRAPIFFLANLPAGRHAATAAFLTEFLYRVVAAGFYGALTGYFARHPSKRQSTVRALIVLPVVAHAVEYIVHVAAGTQHVATALLGSIALSMCTTRFSLFVMRRGLFLPGGRSFRSDVAALARLIAASIASAWRRRAPLRGTAEVRMP